MFCKLINILFQYTLSHSYACYRSNCMMSSCIDWITEFGVHVIQACYRSYWFRFDLQMWFDRITEASIKLHKTPTLIWSHLLSVGSDLLTKAVTLFVHTHAWSFYTTSQIALIKLSLRGSDLLIHPVVWPGITNLFVFLSSDSIWYRVFQQYKPILGQGKLHGEIPALIEHIPVFQRGGSGTISTLQRRVWRSSVLMHHDTVSLLITLGTNVSAEGQL